MSKRQKRQPQHSHSARGGIARLRDAASGRPVWLRSIAALLPLGLLLLTLLASAGQARPATSEAGPEAESTALAERDARREAQREARNIARRAKREAKWATGGEREKVVVKTSCTQIVWTYRNFPDLPGNTVFQKITINGVSTTGMYSFDGPTSTVTSFFNAPPGHYKIDARGKWKTNGVKGTFDIGIGVRCQPAPSFTVEKLQQIEGAGGPYTPEALTGLTGQTIDYEIVVRNTGNVPLTFASFSDARCDSGTITGGPSGAVPAGSSTTYLCKHLLTEADQIAGSVTNTVTLTGDPPEGEGPPIEHTSNTVVVTNVSPPPPDEPKPPVTPGPTPKTEVAASSTSQTPRSGVLALTQTAVPALSVSVPRLSGPQGCVRSAFRASVKSKGVASVSFYLDGRKLKTMTARSARKGQITMVIDPAKLRVGPHKLMAKITMAKTSPSSKAVHGTRTATVLRCRAAVLTPKFTG